MTWILHFDLVSNSDTKLKTLRIHHSTTYCIGPQKPSKIHHVWGNGTLWLCGEMGSVGHLMSVHSIDHDTTVTTCECWLNKRKCQAFCCIN